MDPSPSHARRMALRESDQVRMTASNDFPIDKYYQVTDRLYAALSLAVEDRRLDDAYVLGIRFATFSVDILPKHTCYKRQQQTLRRRNAARVERVLQIVESVVERMDAEEIVKMQQEKQRQEEEERKKAQLQEEEKLKKQQQQEDEKRREEDEKRRKVDKTTKARQEMERSALAKLAAMTRKDREQQTNQQANTAQRKQDVAENRNDEHSQVTKKCEERKRLALEQKRAAEPAEKPTFQPPSSSNQYSERPLGLRRDEERTIELLQETIARQEDRINDITGVKIPALLCKAKTKLAAGHRKEAMHCVYLKRKWDRNVELLKAGIFRMETHILRLEAAAEDREVAKLMKAATDAMQTIQADVGIVEVDDMNRVMAEMAQGVQNDDLLFDEEELMSELMEEDSATLQISDEGVSALPGSQDLLTLPSVPSDDLPDAKKPSLLKPVVS